MKYEVVNGFMIMIMIMIIIMIMDREMMKVTLLSRLSVRKIIVLVVF